jgi:hypothetical protein
MRTIGFICYQCKAFIEIDKPYITIAKMTPKEETCSLFFHIDCFEICAGKEFIPETRAKWMRGKDYEK